MNAFRISAFSVCLVILLAGCESKKKYPVDKRFWTPDDYREVLLQLRFNTPEGEQFPKFSNPENSVVIQKLTDPQNYLIIVDDKELGLNHKNEVAQAFFDRYQEMSDAYSVMDVQDKYVYAEELIAIEKFGLGLQIRYFKLGNDRIREQSDDPQSNRTTTVLESNVQTIIKNFNLYLDNIKDEKRFSTSAPSLADGITTHFADLINTFPEGNYETMLQKANTLVTKTQVPEIKSALESLIKKLESIKKPV